MEYNLNTELKAKDCQICDELYTLIHLAISSDEVIPGQVWSTNVNYVYVSRLKNVGGMIYIINDKDQPKIVIDAGETYIATISKDVNGKTLYKYSYYDNEANKLFHDKYGEEEYFTNIIINSESNFEKLGLEPDIFAYYYLEELKESTSIISEIEFLKQNNSKQKVKA